MSNPVSKRKVPAVVIEEAEGKRIRALIVEGGDDEFTGSLSGVSIKFDDDTYLDLNLWPQLSFSAVYARDVGLQEEILKEYPKQLLVLEGGAATQVVPKQTWSKNDRLAHQIALDMARATIEDCYQESFRANVPEATRWYDIARGLQGTDKADVATAAAYLEGRGLLLHHPSRLNLVQVKKGRGNDESQTPEKREV
jgi:hypothetical protein